MQVLIIDEKTERRDRTMLAALERNIFTTATANLAVAEEAMTRLPVDVLVASTAAMGDALGDMLGMAEERNQGLATILWSSDVNWDLDMLSEAFPSLCGVVGHGVGPETALRIALSAARNAVARKAEDLAAQTPLHMPPPPPLHFDDMPLPSAAELHARSAA